MKRKLKYFILDLRPGHWVKNLLIFCPLIFGENLFVIEIIFKTFIAFILFCLTASIAYIMNDLIDLEKDKLHPIKNSRPITVGKISIRQALITVCFLSVITVIAAFKLNINFGVLILTYIIFNGIYSKFFKKIFLVDIICVVIFFLLRIIAGSIITGVSLSYWFMTMITLIALFLGFNKRYQELKLLGSKAVFYRDVFTRYSISFINKMIWVVTVLILLVYPLYAINAKKEMVYSIPLVYYGVFRYLHQVFKLRNNDGDPISILFLDRKLQLDLGLWVVFRIFVVYSSH